MITFVALLKTATVAGIATWGVKRLRYETDPWPIYWEAVGLPVFMIVALFAGYGFMPSGGGASYGDDY